MAAKKSDPLDEIIPPPQEPDPEFEDENPESVPVDDTPDIIFTEPCLGSVGSKPFLHHVEAQLTENYHAGRMARKPRILPIECGFCHGYHAPNQLDAATVFPGTEFEEYAYNRIAPRPDPHVDIHPDLLAKAVEAVSGTPVRDFDEPGE